jgi:HK97 family phage major capsid protein
MPSLRDLRDERKAKSDALADILREAGPDTDLNKVTLLEGDTAYKAGEIQRRHQEINELGRQIDQLALIEMIGQRHEDQQKQANAAVWQPSFGNGNGNGHTSDRDPRKGLAHFVKEHKGYQQWKASGGNGTLAIDLPIADFKTLVTLTTVSPQTQRRDTVNMALEERTVADLMLQGTTDRGTFEYYEETTFTNTAVTVAEGVAKPEMTLAWTLRTETVRKIAETIPATKESLDDVQWLESQLRGRLAYAVKRTEEAQLLTGGGTGTDLTGLLNRPNIQTQALGGDSRPDAIFKAMQKVRGSAGLGFAEPTAIVMHPGDWTETKLLKTTTGEYIWGGPAEEGPDRFWGLELRQTTGITEGTALVGAFRPHAEVVRREGITILMSTEHASFALENKVLFIAEERLGLAVYRPSAFCTVTGI